MSVCSFTRNLSINRNYFKNVVCVCGLHASRAASRKAIAGENGWRGAEPYDSIPKVPMVPFLGSAWTYFPFIGRYSVDEMHKADIHKFEFYGDIVREKFGKFEVVSSFNPDSMLTLMNFEDDYPSRGDFATLKAYRQKRREWYQPLGLLVTEGRQWSDFRKATEEYITRREFHQYCMEPINTIARDFVELIRQKRDVKNEIESAVSYLNKWSLEALAYILLDERLGCLDPVMSPKSDGMKMIHSIETQLLCLNKLEAAAGNIPFWKFFPTPTWRKFVKAADDFTVSAFNHITKSTLSPEFSKLKEGKQLSLLQHLVASEKLGLSGSLVMMTDLMLSGIDTTSNAAGFLLYELARNPMKQGEARSEIKRLLPKKEDKLTLATYEELRYLKNCFRESMRLHPIIRGNLRILKDDVVISGYKVPAGTPILCVLQVIFRRTKYFEDPNEFIPERWENMQKPVPFYQPFGYGARSCLGTKLAELKILTLITEVLRNFTLEHHYGEIGMRTRLINTPSKPLRLRFEDNSIYQ